MSPSAPTSSPYRRKRRGAKPHDIHIDADELDAILEDFSLLIGMTNSDLIGALGSSPSSVGNHRKGAAPVTKAKAKALAERLEELTEGFIKSNPHLPEYLTSSIRRYLLELIEDVEP